MYDLKNIDQKFYYSNSYDGSVNKYRSGCGTLLIFRENNWWINSIEPYGWFQRCFRYWLGRGSLDDKRQVAKGKRIVSRFKDLMIILFQLKLNKCYCIGPTGTRCCNNVRFWLYFGRDDG